jgi:hypothetical protein
VTRAMLWAHSLWLAILLTFALVPSVSAQNCKASAWAQIGDGALFREGCLKGDRYPDGERYVTLAVDQAKYMFSLAGSAVNGTLPTIQEVPLSTDTSGAAREFSLSTFAGKTPDLLASLVVGYPADENIFVLDGFARIAGVDSSERDKAVAFKSAMFCLNDTSDKKDRTGSRPIVFNAFENRAPVELNDRVEDREHCRDVIQVGPRIVEYNSKEGIRPSARKDIAQRYAVFSLGRGPKFYAYFTVFLGKVVLTDVQAMLLKDRSFLNEDTKTLVAVTLTSDAYSAMAIRRPITASPWAARARGNLALYGDVERPNPVFLTIEKVAPR